MSATISSEAARRTTKTSGIVERFAALQKARRKALVGYVTAGHPDPRQSADVLRALEDAGVDVIEVGVPFSDPMADGPVIQASSQQALAQGMTFDRVLDLIATTKLTVPVVLFSYLNPVLAAGRDALDRAARAGADGLLLTDLPVGSDPELEARFASGPLAFIRLVAPTTPADRMAHIARHGSGFVYLISRLGVTGTRDALPPELPQTIARLRGATNLPICVGFGVSTPEQAAAVARLADGVVVGSAIVRAAGESTGRVAQLVRSMRAAIDAA
ncbi:MAG TPA: tryptophan synthase subunit alpha [Gemmatimonadaceae bacterium]|nr:tryptophan synthase subunit alpha [Gemmatimonadaceae bacterium]